MIIMIIIQKCLNNDAYLTISYFCLRRLHIYIYINGCLLVLYIDVFLEMNVLLISHGQI